MTVKVCRGLTREEASIIIGGGKRAFQKYESGRTPPSDAAVGLIELLARHPEEVAMLSDLRSASAVARQFPHPRQPGIGRSKRPDEKARA